MNAGWRRAASRRSLFPGVPKRQFIDNVRDEIMPDVRILSGLGFPCDRKGSCVVGGSLTASMGEKLVEASSMEWDHV